MCWQWFLRVLVALFLPFLVIEATTFELSSRYNNASMPEFVTVGANRLFLFNGVEFPVIGTNVYWLPALNTYEDIDFTLGNIAQAGFNVVRTWAFNDVTSIPEEGTWFQLISNGTLTVNNGANGLQKLDAVVQLAEKHGLFLIMSLTNNWNPQPSDSIASSQVKLKAPRAIDAINLTAQQNYLSNQYGGMDVYVRELASVSDHSQFYINETIIDAFKNYTTQVISRYVNSPNIFSWEIANDPRCNSTLPNSPTCTATTITEWHSIMADHIKSVDPNHLVSLGTSGNACLDCSNQNPSIARRGTSLLEQGKEFLKQLRATKITERRTSGVQIRGRWLATQMKRQSTKKPKPNDPLGLKSVNSGSSQLHPNQQTYPAGGSAPGGPHGHLLTERQAGSTGLPGPLTPNQILLIGLNWIKLQAEAAIRSDKPIILTSFGVVTQDNAQAFVPFDSSEPVFAGQPDIMYGVSDEERDQIYQQWIQASLTSGLSGVIQYQWGQGGLSVQPGSPVPIPSDQTCPTGGGSSPNDGYSIEGAGAPQFIATIQEESQAFGATPA